MHNALSNNASQQATGLATGAELALLLLGPSTAMAQLWSQIRRLAPHARSVLLTGPAGGGQEAAARLLLDLSAFPKRTFLVFKDLEAEQQLARFNHPSAFPQDLFLYLPEVDRLSLEGQSSLLRLLRTRRGRTLSVVAGTAEDLRSLVSVGRFLSELADLLGTVRVPVPPLNERTEDIPMLLGQLLATRCLALQRPVPHLSEELLREAMQHHWKSDLHELAAVADALVHAECHNGELDATHFEWALHHLHPVQPKPTAPVRMVKLDTVVQEHIFAVLRGCRGNKLRAAEVLGISRSTLYRVLDCAAQNTSLSLAS